MMKKIGTGCETLSLLKHGPLCSFVEIWIYIRAQYIFTIHTRYTPLLVLFGASAFTQPRVGEDRSPKVTAPISHRHISYTPQDSYVFLWITTEDALNRFDGYDVLIYRNTSGSLLKNAILKKFKDSPGQLWVSTFNGDLHSYSVKGRFKKTVAMRNFCSI